MKIWAEILEKFEAGKSWGEIRQTYRSGSQIYVALRIYLKKAEKIYQETQMKLVNSKTELSDVEEQLELAKQERTEVSEEVQSLNEEKERVTQERVSRREELGKLNTEIEELRALGFTTEMIQEIGEIEGRSERKLLKQIRTVEKFNQTKKEFRSLKRRKRIVEREFQEIQIKKTEIQKAVISEGNRLDELKIQRAAHEEAVEVVKDFKRDGYSTEDLRVLKSCLDTLQIKDDPKLSISRLAKGLEMQKSLTILKDDVEKERKKLGKFRKAVAEAENESEILKETTIGTIEAVKNSGLEAINNTAENADATMLDAASKFETIINGHLRRCEDHVQGNMEKVNAALQEYTEFQKMKSRFEETGYPMMLLLGSKDPQLLDQVPILFVAEALNRVLLWVLVKVPEATVVPSQHVQHKDPYLLAGRHKVSVLLELASEGLKQQMIEMTQKK